MRNVQDISQFLREIIRVLKPEGVLVTLDVGKVRIPILAELNHFLFFPHCTFGRKIINSRRGNF